MSDTAGPSEAAEAAEAAQAAQTASVRGGGGVMASRPIGLSPAVLPRAVAMPQAWGGPNMFWPTNGWPPSGTGWPPAPGAPGATYMNPAVPFPQAAWDPDHYAQVVLADFLMNRTANFVPFPNAPSPAPLADPVSWWNILTPEVDAYQSIAPLAVNAEINSLPSFTQGRRFPTVPDFSTALQDELDELQALAGYRSGVLAEARAQNNTILQYFRGILSFNQRSHPATTYLLFAASRIASFLSMYYKAMFNRPRPSSLLATLFPPIDPPGHAAYPSGHATQARLIARCLEVVMPSWIIPASGVETGPLRSMASRIARNREVLGLHYPSDSLAGKKLAEFAFLILLNTPSIKGYAVTTTTATGGETTTCTTEGMLLPKLHGGPWYAPPGPYTAFSNGLLLQAWREWGH